MDENEYSRTPASGCNFLPVDEWSKVGGMDLPTSAMQAPCITPKMVAALLKQSATIKPLLAAGMTVIVWSERPGVEPELDTFDGPARYNRAEWNNHAWEVRDQVAPVTVHWGVWAGFGGRLVKPTKLLAVWGPTGGAGGHAGAVKGDAGPAGPNAPPTPGGPR